LRLLGAAIAQGSDIGECFSTAYRIENGNFESWHAEWLKTAERIHAIADKAFTDKHYQSAKESYLRASSYYRTAEFYLHGNQEDPRIVQTWKKSRDCFLQVVQLSEGVIQPVEIPYEGTTLPGYFYTNDAHKNPRQTLIIQTGFDGTQEELYEYAQAALKRGYNILTFEGPGQGQVIREQGLPFRADWEHVVKAVIDYVVTRPDVDANKLALYGLSFGGYLAPRAASVDHRIKVLIANGGIYDPLEGIIKNHPSPFANSKEEMIEFMKRKPQEFDNIIYATMKQQTFLRWFFEHGMFSFGAKKPHEFWLKYSECTLKDYAEKITSATLICDVTDEMGGLRGQAQELYDHLTCPKTFMLFTMQEGAGYHCQIGAAMLSNQRVFDWLDETFASMNI
jgi:dienelactone hydrolase